MKRRLVFIFTFILSLMVFGCLYSDSISSQSKDIAYLDREKEALEKEVRELELVLSKKRSLGSINSRALELGMVEMQRVWYVKAASSLSLR